MNYPLLEKEASLKGRATSVSKSLAKIFMPEKYAKRVQKASVTAGAMFGNEAKAAVNAGTYAEQYPSLMARAKSRETRLDKFRAASGQNRFLSTAPRQPSLAGAY